MSAPDRKARLQRAVLVAAVIDAVLLAGGAFGFLLTDKLFWLIAAPIIGALVMLVSLYQAGLFDTRDGG